MRKIAAVQYKDRMLLQAQGQELYVLGQPVIWHVGALQTVTVPALVGFINQTGALHLRVYDPADPKTEDNYVFSGDYVILWAEGSHKE